MPPRLAILTGGTSSERTIALASAEGVKNALVGRFDVAVYVLPEELDAFLSQYRSFAAVVPVLHGRGGEDGAVQGFLRTLNVPFLFSDVEAHALASNKALAKKLVAALGVKTPQATIVSKNDEVVFARPVVVKPLDGGSSIGVSIARDAGGLAQALAAAFALSPSALVEDFIGGEEYTVAVVDHDGATTALPVIAIKPKTEFFDRHSKYDPQLVEEICPAPIADDLAAALKSAAVVAHGAIGARHMSRSDFIVDAEGEIWFLEINTIPGMTAASLIPKALQVSGLDLAELIEAWIGEMTT